MIRMGPHAGRSFSARHDAVEGKMEEQEALDLAADWADIVQGLRKDLGHQLFSQWIRPIQLGNFCKDTGTLNLYLPTDFSANWVQDRFLDRAVAGVEDRPQRSENRAHHGSPRPPQAGRSAADR